MGVNHIAIAVKNIEATHRFYTEAMGFELVKVQIVPKGESFARHVFYTTGSARDQMIAFWDLSRVSDPEALRTDICRDLGLAPGTNHLPSLPPTSPTCCAARSAGSRADTTCSRSTTAGSIRSTPRIRTASPSSSRC